MGGGGGGGGGGHVHHEYNSKSHHFNTCVIQKYRRMYKQAKTSNVLVSAVTYFWSRLKGVHQQVLQVQPTN